jgi:L-alanine-DL-glutamate epimerase-like enolase superfamily enzyme
LVLLFFSLLSNPILGCLKCSKEQLVKIVDAKMIVCCPERNFVTLKLVTEEGTYGLGDATLNGRELAVAAYLNEHVLPLLIGRDARRIEDTWNYLYKGAYWRRGPVTMSAIAAVDTALWDLKAKSLGVPLYQLLGGASRESGIQGDSSAIGNSWAGEHIRSGKRREVLRASRKRRTARKSLVYGTLP